MNGRPQGYSTAQVLKQKKDSDKGRVRKIKVKVLNVITKPYPE